MKCSEFRKHMDDLIDGCIDSGLKSDMESHMQSCASCKEEYGSMKSITDWLRRDASSINLKDSQRRGLKEVILRTPARKPRDLVMLKRLMYCAAIFMFAAVGIYFTRGVRVNIVPANESPMQAQIDDLNLQINNLNSQKKQLEADNLKLKDDNERLKKSLAQKTTTTKDWTIINTNLGEAFIQGKIVSIDSAAKVAKLVIYKDDNTPNIDPNIIIPDGVYIFSRMDGDEEQYSFKTGTIDDLKAGDEIALHYIGKSKSARAVLLLKKSPAGS